MSSVDISRLHELRRDGLLSCREHATAPLLIWNYTPRVQYERLWTPETLMCRGLITTTDGVVVARPFGKFFNLEEWIAMGNTVPSSEPFEVYEKLDGSLGILYHANGEPAIATRGSFESEQARVATGLLREMNRTWPQDLTFLFEIIYPENRIVCNYGDRKELVLLAVIETATGHELPLGWFSWALPSARRHDGITNIDTVRALGGDNEEGFVIRFASGLRLKIKLDEYVRLHRLLTGVTPRRVWEILSRGEDLNALLRAVPEEFEKWLREVASSLRASYSSIEQQCARELAIVRKTVPPVRKDQAAVITRCANANVIFAMLDGKPYEAMIWKVIYPPPASAFRCDEETAA